MGTDTIVKLSSICFQVFTYTCFIVAFCIIKFNDLKHIDAKLDELAKKHDKLNESVSLLSKEIGNISGYIQGQRDKNK
jgi:low affinity Fe/Cu permease